MCRADTVNHTNNLLHAEEETTQSTLSTPVSAQLVNPFHNTIDLSTPEGKKSYQKATCGLPTTDKYSGNSNDIIKLIEHMESYGEDFDWTPVGEGFGAHNLSLFKTPIKLTIDAVKAHYDTNGELEQHKTFSFACYLI